MKYVVGPVLQDGAGSYFTVQFDTNPARFIPFRFDDNKTAEVMASKMKEIVEVCVSLTAN
jgi:hypothetical protein